MYIEIKSVLCVTSLVLIFAACTVVHAAEYRCDEFTYINKDKTVFGCKRIAMMLGGNGGCCAENRDGSEVIWGGGAVPDNIADNMCPFCFGRLGRRRRIFSF